MQPHTGSDRLASQRHLIPPDHCRVPGPHLRKRKCHRIAHARRGLLYHHREAPRDALLECSRYLARALRGKVQTPATRNGEPRKSSSQSRIGRPPKWYKILGRENPNRLPRPAAGTTAVQQLGSMAWGGADHSLSPPPPDRLPPPAAQQPSTSPPPPPRTPRCPRRRHPGHGILDNQTLPCVQAECFGRAQVNFGMGLA